jgi:Ferrochelatase
MDSLTPLCNSHTYGLRRDISQVRSELLQPLSRPVLSVFSRTRLVYKSINPCGYGIAYPTKYGQPLLLAASSRTGHSLLEVLQELPSRGIEGVVVCPAGCVSDHLEVLYDLDSEASRLAAAQQLAFARTALPNTDAGFLAMLAELIRTHLEPAEQVGI